MLKRITSLLTAVAMALPISAPLSVSASAQTTRLHTAVGEGPNVVRERIPGRQVNAQSPEGQSALHWAVDYNRYQMSHGNRLQIVNLLLDAGANPILKDNRGVTPLHMAAQRSLAIIRAMVPRLKNFDAGGHSQAVDIWDGQGKTPLHWATDIRPERDNGSQEDIMAFLMENGAHPWGHAQTDTSESPLDFAKRWGWDHLIPILESNVPAVLSYALEQDSAGATHERLVGWAAGEFNLWRACCVRMPHSNNTVLHVLAARDSRVATERARILMESHENARAPEFVNAKNNRGDTVLHTALANNKPEFARMLLEFGADVNAKNSRGETALHMALAAGNMAMARAMLAAGADVNARASDGKTPLHVAVKSGRMNFARELIFPPHNADRAARDASNFVPGFYSNAVRNLGTHIELLEDQPGNRELYAWLMPPSLYKGSIVDFETGATRMHQAMATDNYFEISALFRDGHSLHFTNNNGDTPLHVAARDGKLMSVRSIAHILRREADDQEGALLAVKNKNGQRADEIATPEAWMVLGAYFPDFSDNGVYPFHADEADLPVLHRLIVSKNDDLIYGPRIEGSLMLVAFEYGSAETLLLPSPTGETPLAAIIRTYPYDRAVNDGSDNFGEWELVARWLLDLGADPSQPDKGGKTALDWAEENGWNNINFGRGDGRGGGGPEIGELMLQLVDERRTAREAAEAEAERQRIAAEEEAERQRIAAEEEAERERNRETGFAVGPQTREQEQQATRAIAEVEHFIQDPEGGLNLAKRRLRGMTLSPEQAGHLLSRAVNAPAYESVKFVLEHGADPNFIMGGGNTPLHVVIKRRGRAYDREYLDYVRLLLEHGADPNIRNGAGELPGHNTRIPELLDLVLGPADKIVDEECQRTALHVAVEEYEPGNRDHGQKILDLINVRGANPDLRTAESCGGETAYHIAARRQAMGAIDFVGGDQHARYADNGDTALHRLARRADANREFLYYVIPNHRWDPWLENNDGHNALDLALRFSPVVRDLILRFFPKDEQVAEARARFNREKEAGISGSVASGAQTGGGLSADPGGAGVVSGGGVSGGGNEPSVEDYFTALKRILESGDDADAVARLLEQGMEPNLRGLGDGVTPLMLAAGYGRAAIVRLLLERGADPNMEDNRELAPLEHFMRSHWTPGNNPNYRAGGEAAAAALVEGGADFNRFKHHDSPALVAAAFGDLSVLDAYLAAGMDVNRIDRDGVTFLHVIGFTGCHSNFGGDFPNCVAAAERLLNAGADVNAREGRNGMTPAHAAAQTPPFFVADPAHMENYLRLLAARGADWELRDQSGMTPLDWARRHRTPHVALIETLMDPETESQSEQSALDPGQMLAEFNRVVEEDDNPGVILSLLNAGMDPNSPGEVDIAGRRHRGVTPLMTASRLGRTEMVRALLSRGADVNARDDAGAAALQHFIFGHFPPEGDAEYRPGGGGVARLLLEHGANADDDRAGFLVPFAAAAHGDWDVWEAYASAGGFDPNRRVQAGFGFLHFIATSDCFGDGGGEFSNCLELANRLLDAGADVNLRGPEGMTPAHAAAGPMERATPPVVENRKEYLRLLDERDADWSLRDESGRTPLELAREANRSVVALVEELELDGPSAAELAASFIRIAEAGDDGEAVAQLMLQRMDLNAGFAYDGAEEVTPLMLAARHGRERIAELLLANGAKVDARDSAGRGALMHFFRGHWSPRGNPPYRAGGVRIIHMLLESEADFSAQPGIMLPFVAGVFGDFEIVAAYMRAGMEPDARNEQGHGILHLIGATDCFARVSGEMRNCMRLAGTLLDLGADVNGQDGRGMTPAHLLSRMRRAEAESYVRLLNAAGADWSLKANGKTPLEWARDARSPHADLIEELSGGGN